ncbi:MAG TPA: flagellar biosynthetic protein FliP [Planctomycetaceae bacterium]|nr:flagellar biosynthetic protein FliP [Planctomycetaceae bacterium]
MLLRLSQIATLAVIVLLTLATSQVATAQSPERLGPNTSVTNAVGNGPQRIVPGEQANGSSGQLFDQFSEAVRRQASGDPSQVPPSAGGQAGTETSGPANFFTSGPEHWTSRKGLTSSLQVLVLLTVLSLAPAILLMTTCYVRIIVVLGLLRQALGTGQLPPSQVITAISMFMTMFVMAPVWNQVYNDSIGPYTEPGSTMTVSEAWQAGIAPVREFMIRQIVIAQNDEDVLLFYRYNAPGASLPEHFEEVPLQVLLPAFMLSELKTAFLMGFQIFLPFLLIDLVVASVTISMGMMMLPPAMISLPFKLLLFVLIDGWRLVVEMLLASFGTG